jgi:hypothetical protein
MAYPVLWNRREIIRVGAAGLCGLSLPRLLWADASRDKHTPARSCIFIVLSGGLSHIDSWDPKPAAPADIRGPYSAIQTNTPGMFLTDMFSQLAQQSQHLCLLRSMSHSDTVHVSAAHTMLTGQLNGTIADDSPFIGSLVARLRPSTTELPSYIWLHNMKTGTNKIPRYYSGLAKVGHECAPLRIGYELDNPSSPDFRVRQFDPPPEVSQERLNERLNVLGRLEKLQSPLAGSAAAQTYRTYYERARELVAGPAARQAFELQREPDQVRDHYGRHPLGQYLLMARRLIEAGVRLVTVTGWPGLAPGETQPTVTQVWDMHDDRYADGDSMFGNGPFGMQWSLPRLDQALAALVGDLAQRGLLEETLVAVVSEFGRTPKFEGKGRGRGHWPNAYCGLLAGGGIRGGAVYGASDKQGAFVSEGRPVGHEDFGATLFQALGIPPETRYGPDGFSFRASNGRPLLEVFG